jgi:putative heme transporter
MAHRGEADQGRSRARAVTAVSGQPRPPTAASSHRRRGAAIRAGVIAAIIAGSAVALYAERGAIASGRVSFKQAEPGWVAAGFAAECVSMAAFALLQRSLLQAAATRLALGLLTAIAYASNVITLAVPVAGSGLAAAYSQRQFRARGADTATVSLALLIAGVISTVAFAVIAAVGAVATGNLAAAVLGLLASLGAAAAAALVGVVLHSPRGRARLRRPAIAAIRLSQRLLRRPAGNTATIAARVLDRLGSFNLGLAVIGSAFGWALVNWAADVACLGAAIAAIGVPVPWDKLLLIWSVGAAAANFSPTLYGLGVVDIALITALHAAGIASPEAIGAVLLYRIITFKILVTLLWIGYRYLQDRSDRRVT